jgi:dolichyl-diphosphooligosaccharide---protein glycosyltransferase
MVSAPATRRSLFGVGWVPEWFVSLLLVIPQAAVLVFSLYNAFRIRTHALKEYGMVIHEFDPWFNYRATQYLSKNGWHAFFHWFDYMSWYPLGRPVGTTIYPGLQLTSVAIHRVLRWLGPAYRMTLNDICCTLPCWGGAAATLLVALLTYETTGSRTAAVISAGVMAIVPAHIMRSVGGGYDNECIAIAAMVLTFYTWVRSVRSERSWPIGVLAGLAYGYMVAAWGGFIFVLNMVAVHAAVLSVIHLMSNEYSAGLHRAYTLFYVIGTSIAVCVPPVGLSPFKSLEQLLALVVFVFIQALYFVDKQRTAANAKPLSFRGILILLRTFAVAAAALAAVAYVLTPTGFFGPLSSRVRGLFVKHTRTGNPLVDSVAEHQPASADALWHYLHWSYYAWQIGSGLYVFVLVFGGRRYRAGSSFMLAYSCAVYYFATKMARLVILSGPIASCCVGIVLGGSIDWALDQCFWCNDDGNASVSDTTTPETKQSISRLETLKRRAEAWSLRVISREQRRYACLAIGVLLLSIIAPELPERYQTFESHCEELAKQFSEPQIMMKGRLNNGKTVIVDDYRESYLWLKGKTPEDSRVMAWWDYGYQITGIGNRTSIADGNTWNHEHIATLGKCLSSPVKEAHGLIRHLADYVLIWAGGDDLGKSPHMARIGNSVYRDICPNDPLCSHFGFYDGYSMRKPTPMMKASLLYNLAVVGEDPSVKLDQKLFKEVFVSKYRKVKIFKVMNVSQESKDWIANPANRVCDAPGSWYCTGQYPPAKPIQDLLKKRRDFGQLEDFNRKKKDDKYHSEYMKRFDGRE